MDARAESGGLHRGVGGSSPIRSFGCFGVQHGFQRVTNRLVNLYHTPGPKVQVGLVLGCSRYKWTCKTNQSLSTHPDVLRLEHIM